MRKAKVGLVSFDSLGDSLLYLLIAENLRLNGFDVSLYSNIAYQIRDWVPQLRIISLPELADFDAELAQHDLAIVSPPQILRDKLSGETLVTIRQKWVLICQRAPERWKYDHTQRLKDSLAPEILEQLGALPRCGGAIRYRRFKHESVVDIAMHYLRDRMGLAKVVRDVALTIPSHLQHRRYVNRIVVSPDSAWPEKKDWSASSFLQLCRLLRKRGYSPVIVVAPRNHADWVARVNHEFEVPVFNNIGDLAAYIYESGAMIANDSGNGHLASFLGIPVVTIYRKRNRNFHWRPGWGKTTVVTPTMTLSSRGKSIWRPFITPKRVLKHLQAIHVN